MTGLGWPGALRVLAGATFIVVAGCGARVEKPDTDDARGGAPEEVGVSTSELCTRTELANEVVGCGGRGFYCSFRLMENNFECDEGVVGQASTETLSGIGSNATVVATLLFGESHTGYDGQWLVPATIATQWGHAYSSTHFGWCLDGDGAWRGATWHMDPWSRRAVREDGGTCR